MNNIVLKTFHNINLKDPFFDSLREDYYGFDNWFLSKNEEYAYVQYDKDNYNIIGFLYLKEENGLIQDVIPPINSPKILKIGTFKISPHGTRMGERFIKIIADYAVRGHFDVCYTTIFSKHYYLIKLLSDFGFSKWGYKSFNGKKEEVYVKNMNLLQNDINRDYPFVNMSQGRKYIISIYPKYHSIMFPDSKLNTESQEIIADVSHSNSIHKVYICRMMGAANLNKGDILVVYRTAPKGKAAWYTSVATSICTVEEVYFQYQFKSFDDFYNYACKYSVFDKEDLLYWYKKGDCIIIKMTYNTALVKRINRERLISKIGLSNSNNTYWGFFEISDESFLGICKLGGSLEYIKNIPSKLRK